jgi:general secretion pathway protein A
MYESFFRLRAKPFSQLPNPGFLFMSRCHKRALTYLDYALGEGTGFMLLTGDIGCGKTTVIRELTRRRGAGLLTANVFNTNVTPDQLLAMIADDFGLLPQTGNKAAVLRALNDFLLEQYSRGTKPLLIIDEAHNLTHEALEEVRMLSNLESDSGKLLHIILVGQPELRSKLASPELTQLRQRISFACHLTPLADEEVGEYIMHRLTVAGNKEAVVFSAEALSLISSYSRGIPRLINIICDFLLLAAFAAETKEISEDLVREVLTELDFDRQYWGEGVLTGDKVGNSVSFASSELEGDAANAAMLRDIHRSSSPQAERAGNPSVGAKDFSPSSLSEIAVAMDRVNQSFVQILSRLDAIEKKEPLPPDESQSKFKEQAERSNQLLQERLEATNRRLDELRQTVQAGKGPAVESSGPVGEKARRRGFLGKLFRAV